jgi:hypothetical protein
MLLPLFCCLCFVFVIYQAIERKCWWYPLAYLAALPFVVALWVFLTLIVS